MSLRFGVLVVAAVIVSLLTVSAHGEESTGISVSGVAKVTARPTTLEIPCIISGDAELTADAQVKYRDARKRAVAALDALKMPGLSVESKGYSVEDFVDNSPAAQQMMMRGQVMANTKQKVSVTEHLIIVIKDLDKMEPSAVLENTLKVVDAARQAGLTLGSGTMRNINYYNQPNNNAPPLVEFKIVDVTSLRDQATKQAMEDAKTKAQKYADLAGVKLGRILSIHSATPNEPASNELTSRVYDEIPVNVNLAVQYEIVK